MSLRSVLIAGLTLASPAVAAGPTDGDAALRAQIQEWTVPWPDTRPRDPYVGPTGTVWFVGQQGDYVASFEPDGDAFRRYDLPDGAGPHTVITDEAGAWYAGNRAAHIGLVDPETGDIERFEMPGEGYRDPHTMAFTDEGDIWFTLQIANRIGFLDRDTGEVTLYPVPAEDARPYGLVLDDGDRPWFTLFGTNALGTFDPDAESVRMHRLPRDNARPRRLDFTPDGTLWYGDYAQGYLGRFDPGSGDVEEWRLPGGAQAAPYALRADDRGRVWAVETGLHPNRFVGFEPETERFGEPVALESGGGTVRNMVFETERDAFWFGTDANTIGRARIP